MKEKRMGREKAIKLKNGKEIKLVATLYTPAYLCIKYGEKIELICEYFYTV